MSNIDYDLEDIENRFFELKKKLDFLEGDSIHFQKINYLENEEKIYQYKNLYDYIEIKITLLLSKTNDDKLVKKYENIISTELSELSLCNNKNYTRLIELKEEINKIVF